MTKIVQKNNYYYLQYPYKENKKTVVLEKYIGKEVPKNILLIQEEFKEQVFKKRFGDSIAKILDSFNKEFRSLTSLAN